MAEIDYTAITSAVSITATTETTSQTVASIALRNYPANKYVRFQVFFPWWGNSGSQANSFLEVRDAGTVIWRPWDGRPRFVSGQLQAICAEFRYLVTAGNHTFTLTSHVDGGTGLFQCGAGGQGVDVPGFFRIVDDDGFTEIDAVNGTTTINSTSTIPGSETTANTDLVIASTSNIVTGDGVTPYVISFYYPWWGHSASNVNTKLYLFEDSTSLGIIRQGLAHNGSVPVEGGKLMYRRVPAVGNHTYSIRAATASGTFTISAGAGTGGNDAPMRIRITK